MANLKVIYTREIKEYSTESNKPILFWFLKFAKTSMQWNSFVGVDWVKGKRVWRPTPELAEMYKSFDLKESND